MSLMIIVEIHESSGERRFPWIVLGYLAFLIAAAVALYRLKNKK
jgi:hypothetical protein